MQTDGGRGLEQGRHGVVGDMADVARTQRLGAGPMLSAREKRTIAEGIAWISKAQQYRVTMSVEPADRDGTAGQALNAVVGVPLGEYQLAGAIFAPRQPAIQQSICGIVKTVPVAAPSDMTQTTSSGPQAIAVLSHSQL